MTAEQEHVEQPTTERTSGEVATEARPAREWQGTDVRLGGRTRVHGSSGERQPKGCGRRFDPARPCQRPLILGCSVGRGRLALNQDQERRFDSYPGNARVRSSVAQWQRRRLLIARLLVRVQPEEPRDCGSVGRASA